MKVYIINGPNLNLLGSREPEIYGKLTFEAYFSKLQKDFPTLELRYKQSNNENELIAFLHEADKEQANGVVLNAGAYAHTSIALFDAVKAISIPTIELHVSNVFAREAFRQHSYITPACVGVISGLGLEGYALALTYLNATSKNQ